MYAVCAACGVEHYWSATRGARLADIRCTRKDGMLVCGGKLHAKVNAARRRGPRDLVVCPCGKRRERRNTVMHGVVVRLVTGHGADDFLEVPAGTPICRYWHQIRSFVTCCNSWVATHLTIPCGAINHFTLRAPGAPCPQCHHTEACCGADGVVRS